MKGNNEGILFLIFCIIIAVGGAIVAGLSGARVMNRENTQETRILAAETRIGIVEKNSYDASQTAQNALNAAQNAEEAAAKTNTVIIPPAQTSLTSWATCYGIAPINGSFRLDCERKE